MKRLNEYVDNGGTLKILIPPDKEGMFIKVMHDASLTPENNRKMKRYHVSVDQ